MGAAGSGGRVARALRLLIFLVMALAAVEYLSGSIMEASLIKTYLYSPGVNSTQTSLGINPKMQPMAKNKSKPVTAEVPLVESSENNKIENIKTTRKPIRATLKSSKEKSTEKTLKIIKHIEKPKIIETTTEVNTAPTLTTESTASVNQNINKSINYCELPNNLGPLKADKSEIPMESVEMKYPQVQWGGHYIPPNCTARHRVAIIVPYRDRRSHLAIFLNHMHNFLMKQQIEYGIFIIEQNGHNDFNRAKLMNVGFVESQKLYPGVWQCFVFHDIDLLPTDTRNIYSCPRQPRHMSAAIDKFSNRLPYETIFGGVSAMTKEQFLNVNGFSNKYWGWGAEDDDMYYRLKINNYHIARYKMSIARYAMLEHSKQQPNPRRYQLLSKLGKTYKKDGITTLQYQLLEVCQNHLFTHILVDIDIYHGWKYVAKMLFGNENR